MCTVVRANTLVVSRPRASVLHRRHVTISIGSTSAGSMTSAASAPSGMSPEPEGAGSARLHTRVVRVLPPRSRSLQSSSMHTIATAATTPAPHESAANGNGPAALDRSILSSSPAYGSLQFRYHRSYGQDAGRSDHSLAASDADTHSRGSCGVCRGCRTCKCCIRSESPQSARSSGVWRVDAEGQALNVDGSGQAASNAHSDGAAGAGRAAGAGGAPHRGDEDAVTASVAAPPTTPSAAPKPTTAARLQSLTPAPVTPRRSPQPTDPAGGGSGTARAAATGGVATPARAGAGSKRRSGRRPRISSSEFTGVRVLVVDDERINRTVLVRAVWVDALGCRW